jgi:predicted O-linked N-acetylglucosamine transferase (SPINDLY family)
MPEIDYFLMHSGDFVGDPNEYFTEKLAILSGYPKFLLRSLQDPPKPKVFTREQFNLPEGNTLYFCMQDMTRRHPEMDPVLAALLNRDVESLLIVSNYDPLGSYSNLIDQMKKNGVSNPESRIRIAPNFHTDGKEYFGGYLKLADANLSYRRMCGGMSFYDTLSFHIPQIVWPHESFVSCNAGIYRRMGMDELLADSAEEYVEKAYRLAHDPRWKTKMTGLLANKIHEFVKRANRENGMGDLRQFFKDAVERARTGLPPAHWHAGRFYDHLSAVQLREFAKRG